MALLEFVNADTPTSSWRRSPEATAHGRRSLPEFAETIQRYPQVLECYTLMGEMDFLLRIVMPDVYAYERFFFEELSQFPGVQEVHSNIALSEIKSTTELPLDDAP